MTHPSTTPRYPFEGCCPHSANAHSRERCLVCDCSRPPVQVQVGPTAPQQPDDGPDADLRACGVCGALTLDEDREKHATWHERLLNTMHNTLVVARGTGRPEVPPGTAGREEVDRAAGTSQHGRPG
jgi:hypothetical protein